MTPEDKADELVRKYYTFGLNNPAQSFSWYECKECALIAVNELIKETGAKYWYDVKHELEQL